MPNKRDSAGAPIPGRGKDSSSMRRPSGRGNIPAPEANDEPMTDERQTQGARRISKPNTDGAESDASSDQTNRTRKKAEPVKSACVQCQKRKTKCSGQRPVCRFCNDRNLECSWDISDGLTRTADLKRKLLEATGRSDNLDTLVDAMRDGTDEVSTMLLAKLRLGATVQELASGIRFDASPEEQNVMQSSAPSSSQTSDRGRQHSSSTTDYPSPANSSHPFDWSGPSARLQQVSSGENWHMDTTSYQPADPQSFLTSEFDQSRMTWRTGNPFYKTEDAAPGSSVEASYRQGRQERRQQDQARDQQREQQQREQQQHQQQQ